MAVGGRQRTVLDLPDDVWQCKIAPSLTASDLVRLSRVSRVAHRIAHRVELAQHHPPAKVRTAPADNALALASQAVRSWPSLRVHAVVHGPVRCAAALLGVFKVELFSCEGLSDLGPLARAREVRLVRCNGVTDLSPLACVHALHVAACDGVRDVGGLGSVRALRLDMCDGVQDVRGLGSVPDLRLWMCPRVVDLSPLGQGTQSLVVAQCGAVQDVASLRTVPRVELSSAAIQDARALGDCEFLRLRGCYQLAGVACLRNVPDLGLANMPQLPDVHALAANLALTLENVAVRSTHPFAQVRTLSIARCSGLADVSGLPLLEDLRLERCDGVQSLPGLPSLRTLHVSKCHALARVRWSPALRSISLVSNDALEEVRAEEHQQQTPPSDQPCQVVSAVFIRCARLQTIGALSRVAHLVVDGCDALVGTEEEAGEHAHNQPAHRGPTKRSSLPSFSS